MAVHAHQTPRIILAVYVLCCVVLVGLSRGSKIYYIYIKLTKMRFIMIFFTLFFLFVRLSAVVIIISTRIRRFIIRECGTQQRGNDQNL